MSHPHTDRADSLWPRLNYTTCLIVAAIVCVPSLFAGFFIDDYLHLLTVDGKFHLASPFDVFRFAGGDKAETMKYMQHGPLPWLTDPNISLHFFRPLSSALMVLDRKLFGEIEFLYHLHSLLWYVGLTALVGLLFKRCIGPAALLAMLLFALDEAHFIPAGWWSNRNALVAIAPAVAGLLAHMRWREEGWRWGLPLSLLAYIVGFAGGEPALGIMGYLGAYELIGRSDAWQKRIGALLPAALLSVVYLVVYKLTGHGVHGSGVYIDPIREFTTFAANAPARLVMVLSNQFLTLPIEAPVVAEGLETPLTVLGTIVLAAFAVPLRWAWLRSDPDTRRALLWLLAGAVLSAVPSLATFPSGRVMTLPSIGTAAALAVVLHQAWMARAHWPLRAIAYGVLLIHVVLPPLVWIGGPLLFARIDYLGSKAIAESPFDEGDISEITQIAINPPDPFVGLYPTIMRMHQNRPLPAAWQTMSIAPFAHRITRVNEHALDLEVVDGEMLTMLFEQLVRSPRHPLLPGDLVSFDTYQVRVMDVGQRGPTRVRFSFDEPLESPRIVFYEWRDGNFKVFTPPPVGESVLLEKTIGITNPGYFLRGE